MFPSLTKDVINYILLYDKEPLRFYVNMEIQLQVLNIAILPKVKVMGDSIYLMETMNVVPFYTPHSQ